MNNIVIVSNPVPKNNKSSEVSLTKLLKITESVSSNVCVIAGNIEDIEHEKTTKVISINRKKIRNPLLNYINYFAFQIKAFRACIHNIPKDTKAFFWIADSMPSCMLAAKIKKAEIYYFIYGNVNSIQGEKSSNRTTYLIEKMAGMADYVCAENEAVFDQWGDKFSNANKRVIHLYSDVCEEKSVTNNCIFGMICRVSNGKHVPETIDAFNKVHKLYPEWRLQIIGNGDQFEECVHKVAEMNTHDCIELLGWIPHDEISKYISKWDVAILPSDTEGLPNTLIECMGMGVPCLATAVGAIPNIIDDSINGWILPNTDEQTIYDSIIKVITDQNRKSISEEAYQTIKARYSFGSAKQQFVSEIR